jgi:hypothetical protein
MVSGFSLSMPPLARTSAPSQATIPNQPMQFMMPQFVGEGKNKSLRGDDESGVDL